MIGNNDCMGYDLDDIVNVNVVFFQNNFRSGRVENPPYVLDADICLRRIKICSSLLMLASSYNL